MRHGKLILVAITRDNTNVFLILKYLHNLIEVPSSLPQLTPLVTFAFPPPATLAHSQRPHQESYFVNENSLP